MSSPGVQETTEHEIYHVSYVYDTQDNMVNVTDPVNQTTWYFYDDHGRISRIVSPETGTTEFSYDPSGNMLTKKDNLIRVTTSAYDVLNRLTDISYSDDTPPVHLRYDSYSQGSGGNAVGKLTEVTDASGFRRLEYDTTARLSRVVYAVDGHDFTLEYGYDGNGNVATMTYPSGRVIRYEYSSGTNEKDLLESVKSVFRGVDTTLYIRIP